VHESHEAGTPVTTLDTGEQISFPYNFPMIEEGGASRSAK